jgi:putative membrane protein
MSMQPSHADDPRVELAHDRTSMANFRTQLALDRTTLAWVRTALAMTSFGFGMVAFFRSLRHEKPDAETIRLHLHATQMGTTLLVMGIIATLLAGGSHWLSLRRLRQGKPPALRRWPLSITLALLFAIVGLIGLWALFVR